MGLFGPNTPPQKGTQTLRQQLGLARKKPEWHRTCHTYFYRFHFNTEKGNAWKLNRCRSRPSDPPPPPSSPFHTRSIRLAGPRLHKIGKASKRAAATKKRVHYGNLLKLAADAPQFFGKLVDVALFFYCFSLFFFFCSQNLKAHNNFMGLNEK